MKILIVSGSRNPNGQTAKAVGAISAGAVKAGGNVEQVFLPYLSIERCRQCEDNGWGLCEREGRCTIDDDFSSVVEKIRSVDIVVFATPVYFSDLSESMRALLDRLGRTCVHKAGHRAIQDTPVVGLCVAGGGGGGAPSCCLSLETVLLRCGFDVVDMIAVRRQNLEAKLPILTLVGEWLVTKPTSGMHPYDWTERLRRVWRGIRLFS